MIRSIASIGVISAVVALTAVIPATSAGATPTTRYVDASAPSGGDGSALHPFSSISGCAAVALAGDTCQIASGTYRETVTPPNSGQTGLPITYRAASGASVIVSGADSVSGWTQDATNPHLWSAPATMRSGYDATVDPNNTTLAANQVFSNGTSLTEAQYPNTSGQPMSPTFAAVSKVDVAGTSGTFEAWSLPESTPNLAGATVSFYGGWSAVSGTVIASAGSQISYELPASDQYLYPTVGEDYRNTAFRLTGKRDFLDAPGEWFYDTTASRLLVLTTGSAPTNVEIKKRNYAFDLSGLSNITVSGLSIRSATIRTSSSSSNIALSNLDVNYPSHFMTAQYDPSVPFGGIYDAAHKMDTGIILRGSNDTLENSTIANSTGAGVAIWGSGHVIRNNLFTDDASGGYYTAPITGQPGSSNITITQNTIRGAGRDGINVNTGKSTSQTFTNSEISHNDISGYGTSQSDLGGIYTCCSIDLTGTVIDYNHIHDPAKPGKVGIYIDNYSSNPTIHHNVIEDADPAMMLNGGNNFKIYNNTVASTGRIWFTNRITNLAGTTARNNLLTSTIDAAQPNGNIDHNLANAPASTWVNAAAGDFHLATGSAALGAGIAIPGITKNSTGAADLGAYETGAPAWTAGCDTSKSGCDSSTGAVYTGSTVLPDQVGPDGVVDDAVQGTGLFQWQYAGSWARADNSYSNQTGATATFRFTGAEVQWWGYKDPAAGIIQVSIDGGTPVSVDLYAATRSASSIKLFGQAGLTTGVNHSMVITVTGSKNASATGTFATIDKAIVPPPAATGVDDGVQGTGLNQWQYSGSWGHASGNSYSDQNGATATLRFTGSQVQWWGFRDPRAGIIEVSIDGGSPFAVDLYAATRPVNAVKLFQQLGLASGVTHTMVIRVTGTKNASATDTFATIDYARVLN